MNKTKAIKSSSVLIGVCRILSLVLLPQFLMFALGYALIFFIGNLIAFAFDRAIKTKRQANTDLADRMYNLGVSILDLFKTYGLFVLGIN